MKNQHCDTKTRFKTINYFRHYEARSLVFLQSKTKSPCHSSRRFEIIIICPVEAALMKENTPSVFLYQALSLYKNRPFTLCDWIRYFVLRGLDRYSCTMATKYSCHRKSEVNSG